MKNKKLVCGTAVGIAICVLMVFALVFSVLPLSAAGTEEQKGIISEDYYLLQYARDPQISPDGMTVAFVAGHIRYNILTGSETRELEALKQIYLADLSGKWVKQLTDGPLDSDPSWSPDGSELAFTRLVDGVPQIFLLNLKTDSMKQLISMEHGAFEPAWSPDGGRIVFTGLVEEETENEFGDPKVIRSYPYIIPDPSPVGFPCKDNQRPYLFICSKNGKKSRQLTFGDVLDYSPSWSPDGQNILYTSVKLGGPPYIKIVPVFGGNPRELLRVKIPSAPGQEQKEVVIPAKFPAWSPDGQLIVYNVLGNMMAELPIGVTTTDGKPRTLTSPKYRNFYPTWSEDGKLIYFVEEKEGSASLKSVSLETGEVKEITDIIEGIILSFDVAKDKIIYTATEPTNPSDVWVYDLSIKKTSKITNLNAQLLKKVKLVHPKSFWFKSFDGTPVQGWCYLPLQYEEGKKYPLILYIHGGPCVMWGNEFDFISQVLAANGYIVLKTNPRGSTGYGSDFSLPPGNPYRPDILPVKFYAERGFKDITAGLDSLIEKGFVDDTKMGVMGGSWGGVLTGWTITHTERFKAAITERCGWNLENEWFAGGPIWENPDVYREYSTMTYTNKIKTPTLVIAGESDVIVSSRRSEKIFEALKRVGVPTELVIYPREGHGLCEQEHVVDYMQRVVGWFDTYLSSSSSSAIETPEDTFKLFVECYNTQNFDQMSKISGHPGESAKKVRKKFAPMFQALGPLNNFTILDKVVEGSVSVLEFSADTKIGHIVMYGVFMRTNSKWSLYGFVTSKEVALKMAEPLKTHEASIPLLEEFVRKNYQEITMDAGDLSDLAIMELVALSNSVILFGEGQHHTQELHDLFFKFVVFLSQYGYRDIFLDAPSSQTYYFNAYLKTGSEEYYRFLDDEGSLWKKVYEYNKGLSEEKKIRLWCVDLDYNQAAAVSIVRACIEELPDDELKKEMLKRFSWDTNTYIEEFEKVLHNGSASTENTFLSHMHSDFGVLEELFKENRNYLINQIGEKKYQETLDVIEGVTRRLEIYEQKTSGVDQNPMIAMRTWRKVRENEMKERFVKAYEKLPANAKVLAYFGAWHTDKMPRKVGIEGWDEIETIGHYLSNKYEKTKGKVYSIISISYKDEHYGVRNPGKYNRGLYTDEKMTLGRTDGSLEEIFANVSDHDLWFLDISAGDNPFAKYDYLSRNSRAWDQPQYNGMNGWVNQSKYDGLLFVREIHCAERPNWRWY